MDMNKKRIIEGVNEIIVVTVAIIIAILANFIVAGVPMPFDMTENKIYTLSPASVEAVQGLEEPIQVKVFLSPDMPVPFHNLGQNIEDLLADYAAASGGKLTYQVISPENDDTEAEEAARSFGIEKVGIGSQSEDEVSLRAVYKGIAFVMGEEQQVIPDIRATGNAEVDNFEYDFTKALLNLRKPEPRKIGVVGGFGGPGANQQVIDSLSQAFTQLHGELIQVTQVDLSAADAKIPEDIKALVLINLTQPVSDTAKFKIDQFIQGGGSVGFYQSATQIDPQIARQIQQQLGPNGQIPDIRTPLNHGLFDMFKHYGIQLNADIILDRKNALTFGLIQTQQGFAQVGHPATFLMSDIDNSLPFTRDVMALAMPGVSSVVIEPGVEANPDVEAFELIRTSDVSARRPTAPQSLRYQDLQDPTPDEQPGPFVVAAALQGKIPSVYQDQSLPEGITEDQLVTEHKEGRILVVGNGEFFFPNPQVGFNNQLSGMGGQFFINSLEWLVQDNKLTEIRGKGMPRIIGEIPEDKEEQIQMFNIVFVPLFFAVVGWTVTQFRRRRKQNLTL